jgi:hypothetical protein
VRGLFITIESETEEYIIGSMAVPDYDESYDVHVYINIQGWVLAYYPTEDPASKIIDWKSYDGVSISTTKLRNVLLTVASEIGSPLSDVFYYDFRHPNATNMMVIAEHKHAGGTDNFGIRLPEAYGYYQRDWHFASECSATTGTPKLYLDEKKIVEHGCSTSWTIVEESFGSFTASELMPGTDHTIGVHEPYAGDAYGALVLIYRVP